MCNEDINNVISLDFSAVSDEANWQHTSSNVLQTVGGKLEIDPDGSTVGYVRQVGTLSPNNNRIRLRCNLEVEKTIPGGASNMEVLFQLLVGSTVLYESCVDIDNIDDGVTYSYFLDRTYKYDSPIVAPISLRIITPVGWENKIYLSDLSVVDYNFCEDKVQTYFVIDKLLEDSLTAQSGGIRLKHWFIDGTDTLTTDFFNDTSTVGGNPSNEWHFAKADIDGTDRVAEVTSPNTFNPFVNEFKLDFDTVNSFHGGKPLQTTNGNNYGAGIMTVGLEKPAVLNGDLNVKKGAFFIDIDYSKSLKIVFDVIINQNSSSLFVRPTSFREYTIEWNAQTCEKKFYYKDELKGDDIEVDVLVDGFLSGLTGVEIDENVVGCDETFAPSGNQGSFTYTLNFGNGTGTAGIEYNAYSVPDRFIIEWNGQTFDTGFVGSSSYDQQLINAGVNPSDINTGSPSTGAGVLTFNKNLPFPATATITVIAPLGSTGWLITGICPDGTGGNGTRLQVGRGKCSDSLPSTWTDVYIDDILNVGNGGVLYTDAALTIPFNGGSPIGNFWRIQTPQGLVFNFQYSISTVGVIGNALNCGSSNPTPPTLTETSNTNTGPGGTRTQAFLVGNSVSPGNRFQVGVYSVVLTVIAVAGDTPQSIATKLRDAVNNTTAAQWNAQGSAPTNANGFPPTATSSGATVTIQLNFQNQFFGSANVN